MATATAEAPVTASPDHDDLWHKDCYLCTRAATLSGAPIRFLCGKEVPFIRARRPGVPDGEACVVCVEISEAGGCSVHPRPRV